LSDSYGNVKNNISIGPVLSSQLPKGPSSFKRKKCGIIFFMLRKTPFVSGEIYHLYTRGVDKRKIFNDNSDKDRFLLLLFLGNDITDVRIDEIDRIYKNKKDIYRKEERMSPIVDILAYCLMDNHVHLLVRENEENGISRFARKIFTSHASYFNKRNGRSGALFESRFKSKHVNSEAYFRWLFSYIHLNPLKLINADWKTRPLDINTVKQYVEFLKSYPYSSYKDYVRETRVEKAILCMDKIPDYFNLVMDIQKLFESMYTNEENIIP